MKKSSILFLLAGSFMLFLLLQCSEYKSDKSFQAEDFAANSAEIAKGFVLLESNCLNCHSPNKHAEQKIAPTLAEIKSSYVTKNTSPEMFMQDVRSFVKNPTIASSKMPDAVERYGLMPAMDFTDEELNAMAAYLYHAELKEDDWYNTQYLADRKEYLKRSSDTSFSFLSVGKQYAMKTKSVLGSNLLAAIQSKGTAHALSFCNVAAIPLTDSMSQELNISISRVTDKPRNPDNLANKDQLEYIRNAKLKLEKGEEVQAEMNEMDGKMVGYYPIMTNQMCLQCHGDPDKDIEKETLSKINELYPNDMALKYKVNQLRGIWVVKMDKEASK